LKKEGESPLKEGGGVTPLKGFNAFFKINSFRRSVTAAPSLKYKSIEKQSKFIIIYLGIEIYKYLNLLALVSMAYVELYY